MHSGLRQKYKSIHTGQKKSIQQPAMHADGMNARFIET